MTKLVVGFSLWFLFVGFLLFRGFMVSEDYAAHAVSKSGLQDVKVIEDHHFLPGFWGCDFSDPAGFEFTAKTEGGRDVEGIACCGAFFKSCTMRY